ncbi:MAG: hypothetical protein WCP32_01920 [Bacteroidota bacterium]
MNTSNLIVEFLVIGFGAMLSLILMSGIIINPEQIFLFFKTIELQYVILLLPITYVIGILAERLSASILKPKKIEQKIFPNGSALFCRTTVYLKSQSLKELTEINRSLRSICRAYFLNFILLIISLNTFIFLNKQFVADKLKFIENPTLFQVAVSFFLAILSLYCVKTYRKLTLQEYKMLKEQSHILLNQ